MASFNFARAYATFRGSKFFLFALVAFVGLWLTFHFIVGFDSDFGELNMMLSIEASVSLAFFTMLNDRQNEYQAKQMVYQQQVMEDLQRIGSATLQMAEAQNGMLREQAAVLKLLLGQEIQSGDLTEMVKELLTQSAAASQGAQ